MKRNYSFLPVYFTYFLDNFGLAVIYPIFTPIFLLPSPLLSSSLAYMHRTILLGVLIGLFPLAQFVGSPILGQFSDRFGRKRAFYITIFGTAIGYTLTAMAIAEHAIVLLFVSRFLTGLFASNLTLCLAAIVDMSSDQAARARNFGYLAVIGGISFIIAIAVGGILSDLSPSFPFWCTAALSYLNFFLMLLLFRESHPTHRQLDIHLFKGLRHLGQAVKHGELGALYIGNFFFMLAWVASMQFLPAVLIHFFAFSTLFIACTFIGVGALWALSNFFINRPLARRFFPADTLNVCLCILFIALLNAAFVTYLPLFLLFFYTAVCAASLCWTNSLANVSIKAPPDIQGSILGINQSMTSLASMIAPPLGGLFAAGGSKWIYSFTACSILTALIILWNSQRRYQATHLK